jgi:hypothetical protein
LLGLPQGVGVYLPAQVDLTALGLIGRGRHQLTEVGGVPARIGPALDGPQRSQAGLADVGFDLSQLLGQGLQLSLTAVAQLVADRASQDD